MKKLSKYVSKHELDLVMLSDPDLEVTTRYGLVNPKQNSVPHPTAVVVDPDGVVRYIRVDEKYSERPSAAELMEQLNGISD